MNVGINNIGIYIPKNFQSNFDKKEQFDITESFILNKIGVEKVSRKFEHEDTSDLCIKAFEDLRSKVSVDIKEIDCIVVCTQNPDKNGIPHTSAIVHEKLGASDGCACFDISLGCSGYVYSLSIVKSFMESNGFKNGLLFTADPYSKIIDELDKNTALLFGDAATVTYLSIENSKWSIGNFIFSTRGKGKEALHNDEGKFAMDGRAVFNFTAREIPKQVNEVVFKSGLTLEQIDCFVFHQGSKYIIDTLTKKLKLDESKVVTNLKGVGNTVSSSIPLILAELSLETNSQYIALSGFGVGLSWASCILKKKEI